MSFFQNPFTQEFRGSWTLGDRKFGLTFVCPPNAGRGVDLVVVWNEGPYNIAGNDGDGNANRFLNIQFALDSETFKNWARLTIDIGAGVINLAAATPREIVAALNANGTFTSYFVASVEKFPSGTDRIFIKQKLASERMRFYIENGQGETILRFNARASVTELPSYFYRHGVDYRFEFDDALNAIVELDDVLSAVDQNVINNAVNARGQSLELDSTSPKADWELLQGRSGEFMFTKNCVEGGQIIISLTYNAGATVGDLAKRTCYVYEGGVLSQMTEEPYVLRTEDLIEPECDCTFSVIPSVVP